MSFLSFIPPILLRFVIFKNFTEVVKKLFFSVFIVSDSRSLNDLIKDDAADAVQNLIKSYYKTEAVIASRIIIADNEIAIEQELKGMIAKNMDIAITIGGTGVSPRDMTPEATRRVLEKELTGFSHLMIAESLKKTKFACLSRYIFAIFSS